MMLELYDRRPEIILTGDARAFIALPQDAEQGHGDHHQHDDQRDDTDEDLHELIALARLLVGDVFEVRLFEWVDIVIFFEHGIDCTTRVPSPAIDGGYANRSFPEISILSVSVTDEVMVAPRSDC